MLYYLNNGSSDNDADYAKIRRSDLSLILQISNDVARLTESISHVVKNYDDIRESVKANKEELDNYKLQQSELLADISKKLSIFHGIWIGIVVLINVIWAIIVSFGNAESFFTRMAEILK